MYTVNNIIPVTIKSFTCIQKYSTYLISMKLFDIHLCSILCYSCIKGPLVCIFPSYILHDMQYNVFGRIEAHTKDIFVFWHDYVCVCVSNFCMSMY